MSWLQRHPFWSSVAALAVFTALPRTALHFTRDVDPAHLATVDWIFSILLGLSSLVLVNAWREILEVRRHVEDRLAEFRLQALATTAPLGKDSKRFHDVLLRIANGEDDRPAKWVAARFVARKLARDFGSIADLTYVEASPDDYSELLRQLVGECKERAEFTFPWRPKDWVKKFKNIPGLGAHPCTACTGDFKSCKIAPLVRSGRWLPPHVAAVSASRVPPDRRKRFVTVQWDAADFSGCHAKLLALMDRKSGVNTTFPAGASGDADEDVNLLDGLCLGAPASMTYGVGFAVSLYLDGEKLQTRIASFGRMQAEPDAAAITKWEEVARDVR